MSVRVGIDTGGTFTDFVSLDHDGLRIHKIRSEPRDPTSPILAGVAHLTAPASSVLEIVHGSTIATNAVLERKGARVALVVTAGFEDVLAIGRQTRPELYNLFVRARPLLVEARLTFGVAERLDADGRVVVPVDPAAVDRLAATLVDEHVDVVAVCFLHAYANPAHEAAVAARLRQVGLAVCASHEVLPEYREFERWSTTAANAYVMPLVDRHLGRLETALGDARLAIMQSNGGSISASAARAQAVRTILSGPAAGVVGARAVAREAGFRRIISFDMGGTSTDVSLVDDRIPVTTDLVVGDVPVRLPAIDIHTVGAGGGSIAWVDPAGVLRVGPASAGADPGPACYGTGTDLTVTDANLLLGRLDPDRFLGGRMPLDSGRALRAAEALARRLRLDVTDLLEGVLRVANASMERAIRVVSMQRGHDPRRFVLVAFGGAGGMHACDVAGELAIGTILVPRHAGVLSALGMLVADATRDYSAAVLRPSRQIGVAGLTRRFGPLLARAARDLRAEGFAQRQCRFERQVDVRYAGQSYEITVPWSATFETEFHRTHRRVYGYADEQRATEVVAVRVRAVGVVRKPAQSRRRPRRSIPRPAAIGPARFGGRTRRTALHEWDDLVPGARARGPAIITSGEASVVVRPGFRFEVDGLSNVILRREH